MTLRDAVQMLVLGDGRELPVLSTQGLHTMFPEDDDSAFSMGVRRLVDIGLLERIGRGCTSTGPPRPWGCEGWVLWPAISVRGTCRT